VATSKIMDEPTNYPADSFCHCVEAFELGLPHVSEVKCDVKVTLHLHA
jgi:hypothetical protein